MNRELGARNTCQAHLLSLSFNIAYYRATSALSRELCLERQMKADSHARDLLIHATILIHI